MVALISWHIWLDSSLERNACAFRGKHANVRHIADACRRDPDRAAENTRLTGSGGATPGDLGQLPGLCLGTPI